MNKLIEAALANIEKKPGNYGGWSGRVDAQEEALFYLEQAEILASPDELQALHAGSTAIEKFDIDTLQRAIDKQIYSSLLKTGDLTSYCTSEEINCGIEKYKLQYRLDKALSKIEALDGNTIQQCEDLFGKGARVDWYLYHKVLDSENTELIDYITESIAKYENPMLQTLLDGGVRFATHWDKVDTTLHLIELGANEDLARSLAKGEMRNYFESHDRYQALSDKLPEKATTVKSPMDLRDSMQEPANGATKTRSSKLKL
ncbi:MAG TPA: hypothetical protein VM577_10750 [Anaerovoracaceae bacterium]|nr:hypothetical protein [Anaerovoracaceae bacterium]